MRLQQLYEVEETPSDQALKTLRDITSVFRNIVVTADPTFLNVDVTLMQSFTEITVVLKAGFSDPDMMQLIEKRLNNAAKGGRYPSLRRSAPDGTPAYTVEVEELQDLGRHFNGNRVELKISIKMPDIRDRDEQVVAQRRIKNELLQVLNPQQVSEGAEETRLRHFEQRSAIVTSLHRFLADLLRDDPIRIFGTTPMGRVVGWMMPTGATMRFDIFYSWAAGYDDDEVQLYQRMWNNYHTKVVGHLDARFNRQTWGKGVKLEAPAPLIGPNCTGMSLLIKCPRYILTAGYTRATLFRKMREDGFTGFEIVA